MTLAYASIVALLVAALNLSAESAILRRAQKDRPRLGDKFKRVGYILFGTAVAFFIFGICFHFCPNEYIDPDLYLSLAVAIGIPGCLLVIQGIILKAKHPEKLGQHLRWYSRIMAFIAVCLLSWAIVRSTTNL